MVLIDLAIMLHTVHILIPLICSFKLTPNLESLKFQ